MLFTKKKYFLLIYILVFSLFVLSGCGGSSSDPNENLVDNSVTTQDFSYTYPAQWSTTKDDEDEELSDAKNLFQSIYGPNIYSSGAVTRGRDNQMFTIIALDFSSYVNYINQDDLINFKNNFELSFESNNTSANLLEESYTTINGQSAIKMVYEYNYNPRSKINLIATYKGLNFYMIVYGTEDSNDYYDNLGLFLNMQDSIRLY